MNSKDHEPRLTRLLRELLTQHRVASLGTLDNDGLPSVSMVPYAIDAQSARILIHVSALASHTQNIQLRPKISFMVMKSEISDAPVHDLGRVSFSGVAVILGAETEQYATARRVYLSRFPEAEPMTQLGDFRFVSIQATGGRQVAGFGAARSLDSQMLEAVFRTC